MSAGSILEALTEAALATSKDLCDYTGPTRTIQHSHPISKSLAGSVEPSWKNLCPSKRGPKGQSCSFLMRGQGTNTQSMNQEVGSHQTFNLSVAWSCTSQSPELWEINFCLFHLHFCIFLFISWGTQPTIFCYSSPNGLVHQCKCT